MSESNSDNKETIEAAAVSSESNADVKKVEKETKVKKTTKVKPSKKVEKVVASEVVADETVVEKEEVMKAPYFIGKKDKEATKSSISTSTYLSIAAGILLVTTLTVVTFFQDEFDFVVASSQSNTISDSLVSDDSVATQVVDLAINENVQVSDQIVQANYGYQPVIMSQAKNYSFDETHQKQRAAYGEALRMHNERMAKMHEVRTTAFKRMDQDRIDRQNKIEVMRVKTQQIQLEMQQKMKAAYDEFNAT